MGAHLRKSSVNPDRAGDNARMPEIVLATLNARHAHASLGLRYLMANLGEFEARAVLREFVIGQRTEDMAEAILAEQPVVAGFGVYIWNVEETRRLVAQLRVLRPDLVIVLGGPEVSHEIDRAGGRARLPFDPEGLELPHPRPRARHALPPRQARHLSASSG
ncbi:MAG: hypothetical protein KatS3mg126_1298 [Lysobacteraceae bacterium]|nr:MAG: hypothetical protein KatS3mg126_1298 [Xanthomonadaceae bacterium]